jgi:hypothetical protein
LELLAEYCERLVVMSFPKISFPVCTTLG